MAAIVEWSDRVRRRLRLRDVDILLTVIQTGSMGRAAAVLNMSQPAISKSVAYLERTVGVRLLDRGRYGVEPTPYGRALVKRGASVFDELRRGVQDIASLADPTSGEVRMGGSEHTISAIYAPLVRRFSQQYPRMSFHIVAGDLRSLSQELDARRIDFLVSRVYKPPPSEEHSIEPLFEDRLVVVTTASSPLARRKRIAPADLLDHPWTLQPRENSFGGLALDTLQAAGLGLPRIMVETTSIAVRDQMLATGRYLTMVPRFCVLLQPKARSLRVLPVKLPDIPTHVAIFTLKNRSLGSAVELFIKGVRTLTRPLARPDRST
jgi:DNA-binding transcriptional LysR family regulator